jgi:hypothetical protein
LVLAIFHGQAIAEQSVLHKHMLTDAAVTVTMLPVAVGAHGGQTCNIVWLCCCGAEGKPQSQIASHGLQLESYF